MCLVRPTELSINGDITLSEQKLSGPQHLSRAHRNSTAFKSGECNGKAAI